MTNEYKVSKTAENVDWESVQKKYSEILDRYKDKLEKASGSGKDYPCEVYHIHFGPLREPANFPPIRQTVFNSMQFRRLHDQ